METITQVSCSFTEKYFQILPEGRIRRKQYFYRMIIGGIVVGFLFSILSGVLVGLFSIKIAAISSTIASLICLFFWYILNTKRIRDIGKDPKIVQNISIGIMIWYLIESIYRFIGELGWFPGYITEMQQILSEMQGMQQSLNFPFHQIMMQFLQLPFAILIISLFLYLLFYPGKKEDNEFGHDPINTRIGFLG